jgi:hypothetical protein
MKSAYELAMERFEPVKALSEDQKSRIGEIESRYKAKIAELEITRQGSIDAAVNDPELQNQLIQRKQHEIGNLEEKSEREKECVRNEQ